MEYLAKCGESNIFNLGNGVGFTVKEIIETARKVLGWKPQYTDLETIISTAWNWHINHHKGNKLMPD